MREFLYFSRFSAFFGIASLLSGLAQADSVRLYNGHDYVVATQEGGRGMYTAERPKYGVRYLTTEGHSYGNPFLILDVASGDILFEMKFPEDFGRNVLFWRVGSEVLVQSAQATLPHPRCKYQKSVPVVIEVPLLSEDGRYEVLERIAATPPECDLDRNAYRVRVHGVADTARDVAFVTELRRTLEAYFDLMPESYDLSVERMDR